MSSIVRPKHLTAEDFLVSPSPNDGARQELIRGEIVAMPPPGGLHGVCCTNVVLAIGGYVKQHRLGTVACNDAGFVTERGPDSVRGPDISFWTAERLKEVPVGYFEVAPDLAVEVLSPGNTRKQILAKLTEYFEKGVRLVWVLSPEDRTLTIYRTPAEARLLHETASASGEDVLPGFACRVGELLP